MPFRYLSVCSGIEAASVKTCTRCRDDKPLGEFHRQRGGPQGRHSWCKVCANTYYRAHKKRTCTPDQKRRWLLKTRYRLTIADVDGMRAAQGGSCGICSVTLGSRFHIDHDHLTRKVRGLLCHRCNVTIGGLDDEVFRARALAWLERGR